jgi:hypothetical protein
LFPIQRNSAELDVIETPVLFPQVLVFAYTELSSLRLWMDWNSSNILTGVPGFESLSLRHLSAELALPEAASSAIPSIAM